MGMVLLVASICLQQTSYANANISIEGCEIVGSTSISGYVSRCVTTSWVPAHPYFFALQRKTSNNGWTTIANSGYIPDQSYSWPYPGPGRYRVLSRVWKQTGQVINANGVNFPCPEVAEFYFVSPSIKIQNLKQWVSYPLGFGDDAEIDIAVRNNNSESRVYFRSGKKMFEHVWTGTTWASSELVPGVENVRGPIYAEPGATTNLFYVNKQDRMSRFTRNASGTWSNTTLPGSYPVPFGKGQIAAGPEGIIYTSEAEMVEKIYLLELQADGVTFDELDIEVDNAPGGGPTPYLVRMPNGVIVYRSKNQELVAARPFSNPRYTFAGNTAVFNVPESRLATDGTHVFYGGTDGQIWIWTMTGDLFNSSSSQLGTLGNVAGEVSASTDRPGEVFYRGTDNRMWRLTMTSSGVIEEPLATNTNVRDAIAAKQKIVYRDNYDNIWHQYETLCSYKTSFASAELEEDKDLIEFTVFPNPANNHLTIHIESQEDITGSLQLFDMTGRMVRSLSSEKLYYAGINETNASIGDLPKGTYLLRWQGGDLVKTKSVIFQ